MHFSTILSTTVALVHLLARVQAKAVFAHYMVGSNHVAVVDDNAHLR